MNEKQLEDEPVPVSCKTYHDPPPKYPHFYSFRLDQTENLKLWGTLKLTRALV